MKLQLKSKYIFLYLALQLFFIFFYFGTNTILANRASMWTLRAHSHCVGTQRGDHLSTSPPAVRLHVTQRVGDEGETRGRCLPSVCKSSEMTKQADES